MDKQFSHCLAQEKNCGESASLLLLLFFFFGLSIYIGLVILNWN